MIAYYNKSGFVNKIENGIVNPLIGYQSAFIDADSNIIGFAKVDIVDGPRAQQSRSVRNGRVYRLRSRCC
jgi:hypothetical protein